MTGVNNNLLINALNSLPQKYRLPPAARAAIPLGNKKLLQNRFFLSP
jgi:hypothetical protein